ncbi:putative zinc-binding peptidase [Ramlibacter sp.]|uniref:zinc-binding metallopeptidase family protein n=1 Tax=Ramlibacter sp. TaxID=1917967 RepID=UPI002CE793C9|nr:putative zinc-binding peptidase [Ramlibacter sp.]HWI82876.1 putative zinc-binding peptidase [Ramlibacter sp.]
MKTFRCGHCGQPLFFENVQCLRCGSAVAFLPDRLALAAIEPAPGAAEGLWRQRGRGQAGGRAYRLCRNHGEHQACNFAVSADDPNPLCVSCRQTRLLPDLSLPDNHQRWYRIEMAKRRLFYTLAKLGLVAVEPPGGRRDGPIFEFLADLPGHQVLTGHCDGVITLNIAEADDTERVRRRVALHEPYRTLLGHLRHESGHYYWDRLIRDGDRLDAFRAMFGDDRLDYGEALDRYYAAGGAAPGWQQQYVTAYATAHPWEDWAETWAHYLHMVDLLETAASYSTRLTVPGDGAEAEAVANPFGRGAGDFGQLVEQWIPLTLLVNSLNRSLGHDDAYPFALSPGALDKLRFVHDVIHAAPPPAGSRGEGAAPT